LIPVILFSTSPLNRTSLAGEPGVGSNGPGEKKCPFA
jgi:hypothetical protein